MGTTNKRSIVSQFLRHRWLLSQVPCVILHIVWVSHNTDQEECSKVFEKIMWSKCSKANAKTSVHTWPDIAHGMCVVHSSNVCIPEKNGMCTRVTGQSCSQSLKAIERSREELSYSLLRVCGSVICLEDMWMHYLYCLPCETQTDHQSLSEKIHVNGLAGVSERLSFNIVSIPSSLFYIINLTRSSKLHPGFDKAPYRMAPSVLNE